MKKLIILIIFLAPSLSGFGQMPTVKVANSKGKNPLPKAYYFSDWSLGISIKSSNESILSNDNSSNDFELHHQPKFSYDVELFIERRLDNNWILVSGVNFRSSSFEFEHILPINFSKVGSPVVDGNFVNQYDLSFENSFEQTNFIATVEYEMFGNEDDYQDGEDLEFKVTSINNLKYLGVPLAVRKEFGTQKLRFSAKVGFEPAVLIKSSIDYQRYHQSGYTVEGSRPNYISNKIGSVEIPRVNLTDLEIVSQKNNLKNFQFNSFINVGLLHTFKYHTFFLEAEYKRGLVAFAQNNMSTDYLNSFGFKTGFIKRFKESKVIDMTKQKRFLGW